MLTYWCETSKFSFHWNKNQLENLECAKAGSFYLPLFTFVYLCLLLLLFQIFETKDRGTKSQIGTVPLSCISKIWNTIKEFTFFHNPKSITVGVITNETLVLVNFSAQDASILKISAHHQEEVLRIPKHPQHAKFGWFWAKLWQSQENKKSKNWFDIRF